MTRSDHLRQALADHERRWTPYSDTTIGPLVGAARFALRVWESDQQLVEKVAAVVWRERYGSPIHLARAVLAAITEEDQK